MEECRYAFKILTSKTQYIVVFHQRNFVSTEFLPCTHSSVRSLLALFLFTTFNHCSISFPFLVCPQHSTYASSPEFCSLYPFQIPRPSKFSLLIYLKNVIIYNHYFSNFLLTDFIPSSLSYCPSQKNLLCFANNFLYSILVC